MGSVANAWPCFNKLNRDSDHTKNIEQLLQTANFPHLCEAAVHARRILAQRASGSALVNLPASCSVDRTKFASGYYNVVVELNFPDSVRWIARIRLSNDETDDETSRRAMLSEIATMTLVKDSTTIPVPRVFGYNTGVRPFGYRYMLMEALPGAVLDRILSQSVPDVHKRKVASQLADYIYQLSNIRFERIGRIWCGESLEEKPTIISPFSGTAASDAASTKVGPFSTSLEYFYRDRRRETHRLHYLHPNEREWTVAAWIFEKALPSMVLSQCMKGPFPLCHMDLHYKNILFDPDYNITGIIDWTGAQTVPIERFVVSPEFLTRPCWTSVERGPIKAFRKMFVEELQMIELRNQSRWGEQPFLLSGLVGTPLADLVYMSTCSFSASALNDARLVLRLLFGGNAEPSGKVAIFGEEHNRAWEVFKQFCNNAHVW